MPLRSQPTPVVRPVSHAIMGAASGILATVAVQLLLVLWSEHNVARAVHALEQHVSRTE
jgi:hypothetical protein